MVLTYIIRTHGHKSSWVVASKGSALNPTAYMPSSGSKLLARAGGLALGGDSIKFCTVAYNFISKLPYKYAFVT